MTGVHLVDAWLTWAVGDGCQGGSLFGEESPDETSTAENAA
jgi:hypothetical protein